MLLALFILSNLENSMDGIFRVSHMALFNDGIVSVNQVWANGSLMGSAGGSNAHSGTYEHPLLIDHGKQVAIDLTGSILDAGQIQLLGKIGSQKFVFQVIESSRSGSYLGNIINGKVRNIKRTDEVPSRSTWANEQSNETFDPRSEPSFGFQDVAEVGTTSWYKIPYGFQIGGHECDAGIALGTQYGIGLKLPTGIRIPFINQLTRLKDMVGKRLVYVSPEGWFVVMVDSKKSNRYLVWIEPQK